MRKNKLLPNRRSGMELYSVQLRLPKKKSEDGFWSDGKVDGWVVRWEAGWGADRMARWMVRWSEWVV